MSNPFKSVEKFMNACGHTVAGSPIPANNLSNLYKTLIDEEYGEFLEAFNDNDDTEQLDACFDMMWVIIGYMKSRGWDCDASWAEGARSNLDKIDRATGKVIKREDGKILKPDRWTPPDFKQFV
jgi:predicted HAD superfamily Cof-like phosphohydrolase